MKPIQKDVRGPLEVDAFLYRKGCNLLGDLPLIGDRLDAAVVLEGTTLMRFGPECVILQKGDIYYISPDTMAIFEHSQDLRTVHFSLVPDEKMMQRMPRNARVLRVRALEYLPYFTESVAVLEKYYSENPREKTDFIDAVIRAAGVLLTDLAWEHADEFVCFEQNELVADAYMYISEHYMEPIDMDFLTKKYYVSNSYLTRLFKKYANIAPMETVLRFRILAASESLLRNAGSISDIAQKVGYSSLLAFQKAFYRRNGCFPSEFRQRYSEEYVNARFIYVDHKIQYVSMIFPNNRRTE